MIRVHGGITAPKGFMAAAVCAGIRRRPDLALLISDVPATAAGVFTVNRFAAAPVEICRKNLKAPRHQAVIINAGNANCLTGKAGINDALAMVKGVASLIGCRYNEVLVCSTGIIGKRLPIKKIKGALALLVSSLSGSKARQFADAIMTTDTFKKEVAVKLQFGKKQLTIAGVAKGAGMIAPKVATMLSVITTDAKISKALLQRVLKVAVEDSFNSITVDNGMSTNDTVLIFANGRSGVEIENETIAYKKFISALTWICLELAKMIVKDGEGATKFIEVDVKGAKTKKQAKDVALAIANYNLFKAMCYGENPNFGRLAAACGASVGIVPALFDAYLNETLAIRKGVAVRDQLPRNLFKAKDINVTVYLNLGRAEARVFTSDLTPEYVKINAEYS